MKVALVAHPTEMETDIVASCADAGDEARIYAVSDVQAGHGKCVVHDRTNMTEYEPGAILDLIDRARDWKPDLLILRYPYWIGQTGIYSDVREMLRDTPTLVYLTEQGPTRTWGFMHAAGWENIGVNCQADVVAYRVRFPEALIHYLPFGCREIRPEEQTVTPRFQSDIVSDGWAHWECGCYGGWKRHSVDKMVRPLAGMDLALYGRVDKEGLLHSWSAVPDLKQYYRGEYPQEEYPKVYASAKVYAGASWNWAHGGYGIRFAKILSCGIATVWHKTVWQEEDGLVDGEQAIFCSTPEEVKNAVRRLLENPEDRRALGARGRAWAREHWDWDKNLRRVANDIG